MLIEYTSHVEQDVEAQKQAITKVLEVACVELQRAHVAEEVSISFVTNEQIRVMNRTYRGKDAVTDVISFAFDDVADELHLGMSVPKLLGDIVIAVERAETQALEYGHSVEREICFLALHGYLHLCGFDHQTVEQEEEMFTLQERILTACHLER